jgi:hypothetical protein
MKKFVKLMAVSILILSCWQTAIAQDSKADKKAAKAAKVKGMVDSVSYVFKATNARPQRGGSKQLTSDYDVRVVKDTVKTFLPYFGRSFVAPPPGSNEGGIKFTSTSFTYTSTQNKKGGWDIVIKPKERNSTDFRDVEQLSLSISTSGYATLRVTSSNRDAISFDGYVESAKGGK